MEVHKKKFILLILYYCSFLKVYYNFDKGWKHIPGRRTGTHLLCHLPIITQRTNFRNFCPRRLADQVNYTVKREWKALHCTLQILKNGNSNTNSLVSIYITSATDSWIRGVVLGSLKGGTDKCVRPGAKQSGLICKLQTWLQLGSLCRAQKDSSQMRPLFIAYTGERA
jgi:hypothetical protein